MKLDHRVRSPQSLPHRGKFHFRVKSKSARWGFCTNATMTGQWRAKWGGGVLVWIAFVVEETVRAVWVGRETSV